MKKVSLDIPWFCREVRTIHIRNLCPSGEAIDPSVGIPSYIAELYASSSSVLLARLSDMFSPSCCNPTWSLNLINPIIPTELENERELILRLVNAKTKAPLLEFTIDLKKFMRLGNTKLPELKSLPINSVFFATEGGSALYTTEKLYIRLRSQGLISVGSSLNKDGGAAAGTGSDKAFSRVNTSDTSTGASAGESDDDGDYSENQEAQETIRNLKDQIAAVEDNVRLMHEAYDDNFLPGSALVQQPTITAADNGAASIVATRKSIALVVPEDTEVYRQYVQAVEQASREIEYNELCAAVARAEAHEALEAEALEREERALKSAQEQLQPLMAVVSEETAEIESHLSAALDIIRDELAGSKFMLEARQLKLMSELQSIYPIEQLDVNSEYAIRGIELPKDLSQRDDEVIAAGLGYVVHLLILLAKYLEVPLRYQLIYQASRSMIRDPISSGGLPSSTSISGGGLVLPLYRRNVDRDRFERALIWLQRDVEQLLASRGLGFDTKKDILGNLQQLFVCDMCPRLAT